MQIQDVMKLMTQKHNVNPLFVGGCVRDKIMGIEPKDFDIEVHGCSLNRLAEIVREYADGHEVNMVGVSFGVIKAKIGGADFDFSVPRRDNKVGSGHKGFEVEYDESMSIEEAAARRDFTMNALAATSDWHIINMFGGIEDIENKILRATSEKFSEDPLRVLRGMQFAARFDMTVEAKTANMAWLLRHEYYSLAVERVWGEWEKWAEKGVKPSQGIKFLASCGWLANFKEIKDMVGVPQDSEWHPEGDVFQHTLHCIDAAAEIAERDGLNKKDRVELIFATLCHDFGKVFTTQFTNGRWRAPGHDEAGAAPTASFIESIGGTESFIEQVVPLVKMHMRHIGFSGSKSQVRRIACNVNIKQLARVVESDHSGRPPLAAGLPKEMEHMLKVAQEVNVEDGKPEPILMGRHLIEMGMTPNKEFGKILKDAFEAQLDGVFVDVDGAKNWFEARSN